MTDDLVKRLRDVQENWPWCEIELEAADRIEQLERALLEIKGWNENQDKYILKIAAVINAVLPGEKKDG